MIGGIKSMDKYLQHYGIEGMRWGVRRYENLDGTLTEAGKKRYQIGADGKMSEKGIKRAAKDVRKNFNKAKVSAFSNKKTESFGKHTEKVVEKYKKDANKSPYEKKLTAMDKEAIKLNEKYKDRLHDQDVQVLIRDFNRRYQDLQVKNTVYGKKVAEKYIGEFNKALVKDLNLPDADAVADYITNNQPLWDVTYISNYAWFDMLA